MKIESRGVSAPSFAVVRELARVYKECLQQTLFVWPSRYSNSLIFDSALDSFWKKSRLSEIFEPCLNELKAELGPAYQHFFAIPKANEVDVYGAAAVSLRDITVTLDECFPEWSHDFVIDREPILSAALYQIHGAVDQEGHRWLVKVIKLSAKAKMESTLHALREIELTLKPLRRAQYAARLVQQLETLRRSLYREADLSLERRILLRMKSKIETDKKFGLRFPRINDSFANESALIYESLEGISLDCDTFDSQKIELGDRAFLARRPIQASVLKAFEMGLIRGHQDTRNLVLMKDGMIGVRYGWTRVVPDGADRTQVADLLKIFYAGDFSNLSQEMERAFPRASKNKSNPDATAAWQQRLKERVAESTEFSLLDFAVLILNHAESLGIALPQGFIATAKLIHSLNGIGKTISPQSLSVRYEGRVTTVQAVDLNSHIARACRIHSRR